jgi:ATP-dependent helicase/nuclease subunit B
MKIEAYLVPPGVKDFTETLLQKALKDIKGNDYSSILYIAPTTQLINNWRRVFHEHTGNCYIPPRIMTLKQLSRRLYYTYGDKIIIPKALIPVLISELSECGMGFATIVADFIEELKQQYPLKPLESIKDNLIEAFTGFEIPEEVIKRALNAFDTFSKYTETLNNHNLIDENDALTLSSHIAGKYLKTETLILDGFYEITPAEELLINTLITNAKQTIIRIPISGINDDLSYCYSKSLKQNFNIEPVLVHPDGTPRKLYYYAAPSIEEEVEAIARHIKGSFISGRLRNLDNTFVVFPSLSQYRDIVERVFKRYGIPYNIAPKKYSETRAYLDLLSLLEAISEDYPKLLFSRFLTSPYFKNIPEDIKKTTPRICLASGIVKGKDSWLKAFKDNGTYTQGNKIFKTLKPLEFIKNKASYGDYLKVIYDVLDAFGFSPPDDSEAMDSVYRRAKLLDSVLEKDTDLAGFTEILRKLLNFAPKDEEKAGVRIDELFNVRGLEPEFLYLGGLKDGDIPSKPEIDFLLPDSVRGKLGLVDLKRFLHLQEHIFRRLTVSAGGLYMSYPSMEGDKFFLPSIFLSEAEEREEKLFGVFSKEEDMLRKGRTPLSEHIKEIKGIQRFTEKSVFNVTDIDDYRRCPRRYFIEKVLGLEYPEIKEYEIEAMTIGSIAHEVMERLISDTIEDFETFTRKAEAILNEVLGKWHIESYFKELIKESFLDILPEIYELEEGIKSDGYSFKSAEYVVEGEPVKGIKLRGKIDRIDAKSDNVVQVIDYKTGAADLSGTQTLKKGATLQPFLYAAMLKTMGMSPERVGIYSLKDIKLKWLPGKRDKKTLDDYIIASLKFLSETVEGMRKGDFTALPLSEQTCRNCHESPYCPYIQSA